MTDEKNKNGHQKCVHLCPEDIKFIKPFIQFIEEHFEISNHTFLFLIAEGRESLEDNPHAFNIRSPLDVFKHLRTIYTADKIILHSLMGRMLICFLAMQPWLLKKCYWVIWGRDLYSYQYRARNLKSDLFERLRGFVIKRIGHIVIYFRGDYELAKKWYGARAQFHQSFVYQSNTYKDFGLTPDPHVDTYILVGNSAHIENNHHEAFELLSPYKDQNIKIFAPLTYGKDGYAKEVIAAGHSQFGDKFVPLTTFMALEEYMQMLANIDIAVFAHDRQQGVGNIVNLLGMGKTIYLKPEITTWDALTDFGIKLFDVNAFDLTLLDQQERQNNQTIIKKRFSTQTLLKTMEWITQ